MAQGPGSRDGRRGDCVILGRVLSSSSYPYVDKRYEAMNPSPRFGSGFGVRRLQKLARMHPSSATGSTRAMYRKVMAMWVSDLLGSTRLTVWRGDDPVADYRDRDWRRLYEGSVLDD